MNGNDDAKFGVFVWFAVDDVPSVVENVIKNGTKIDSWEEDPRKTGEPYTHVEQYEYMGCEIEIFFINEDEISDVRAFVPVEEEQRSELHEELLPAANFHLNLLESLGIPVNECIKIPQVTSQNIKRAYIQLMGGE